MPKIDDLDRSILAELRKNGRISYVELAEKVDNVACCESPIRARLAVTLRCT